MKPSFVFLDISSSWPIPSISSLAAATTASAPSNLPGGRTTKPSSGGIDTCARPASSSASRYRSASRSSQASRRAEIRARRPDNVFSEASATGRVYRCLLDDSTAKPGPIGESAVLDRPPVLIHIGYHKTGTNWLQRHFFGDSRTGLQWVGKSGGDHPARQLVRARPLEFDAAASRAQFEPLLRRAGTEGLLPVVSYERLSGHPFSGGHDSKEIANRLKEVFPEAKVLVVIREQRSMILSTYKQYVKAGGPSSLPRFLAPPRSTSMRVPWFDLRQFEYEHLLRHYRAVFGEEAVLALAFDQFVRDPPAYVAAIGRFAGHPVDDELLASLPFDARS